MASQIEKALAGILAANEKDPKKTEVDGRLIADNVLYSSYMAEWQHKLYPDVHDAVKLAVSAQHVCRWEIPRDSFPEGRAAYLQWRQSLARKHADILSGIMEEVAYDEDDIKRASNAVMKKNIKGNPDSQVVEDCACLVFLSHYFDDFISKHTGDKLINIVQKTWAKMSDEAHAAALGIDFSDAAAAVIHEALQA